MVGIGGEIHVQATETRATIRGALRAQRKAAVVFDLGAGEPFFAVWISLTGFQAEMDAVDVSTKSTGYATILESVRMIALLNAPHLFDGHAEKDNRSVLRLILAKITGRAFLLAEIGAVARVSLFKSKTEIRVTVVLRSAWPASHPFFGFVMGVRQCGVEGTGIFCGVLFDLLDVIEIALRRQIIKTDLAIAVSWGRAGASACCEENEQAESSIDCTVHTRLELLSDLIHTRIHPSHSIDQIHKGGHDRVPQGYFILEDFLGVSLKRLLLSGFLCLVWAISSNPVGAKDLKGRAGVGIEQTLGGVSGLTLRYWPAQAFGISLTAGARISSYDGLDADGVAEVKYASIVTGSLGIMYNLAQSLHANLGVGLRVAVGFQSGETNDIVPQDANGTQINFEIPIQLEFFLSDSFSVSVATGVLFALIPEEGPTLQVEGHEKLERGNSTIIDLGAGSVSGTLGVVYYF